MPLVRWDPLREFEEMNERLSRAYGRQVLGRAAEGGKEALTVPDNIDEAKVSADFKDGVLNVRLPKTEKAKHKAIEVKVG